MRINMGHAGIRIEGHSGPEVAGLKTRPSRTNTVRMLVAMLPNSDRSQRLWIGRNQPPQAPMIRVMSIVVAPNIHHGM